MDSQVNPLVRVRATVEAGTAETDPAETCTEMAFIYGIGPGGVSPFECLLTGKQAGDSILFRLDRSETDHFFSHLAAFFHSFFAGRNEAFFRVRITGIETPEPREVVRAIADATSPHAHGGGCDCGCS